jgi:hypothetical protein
MLVGRAGIVGRILSTTVEVLNLNPAMKKAIILLLYHSHITVLKRRFGMLGPILDVNMAMVQ